MSTPAQTEKKSSDAVTFKHLQTIKLPRFVFALHMRQSTDLSNALLLTGCNDNNIRIYSATIVRPLDGRINFKRITEIKHHIHDVTAVNWHPTRDEFVSASDDRSVVVWDAKDIKHPTVKATLLHSSSVYTAKYSSTGLLLTGSRNGELRLYKGAPSFVRLSTYKATGDVLCVAWHNNLMAALFLKSTNSYTLQVWRGSLESKNIVFSHDQKNCVTWNHGLQYNPYGALLSSGYKTKKFYIYNPDGQVAGTISMPHYAEYLEVLRSGMVATTCGDNKLRVHIGSGSIGAFEVGESFSIAHYLTMLDMYL